MGSLFSFSLLSSALLAAMLIPYNLFLSREKQPGMNRATLLMIYALSLLGATWVLANPIPLIDGVDLSWLEPETIMTTVNGEDMIDATSSVQNYPESGAWINVARIVTILYFLGGAVITIITLVSVIRLCQIILKAQPIRIFGKEIRVYSDKKLPPFSVVRTIILSKDDLGSESEMIMAHESAHISRRHWADLIVARCVLILQWYNPAAWLMMRELRAVHEYQADSDTIAGGIPSKEYQLMLIERAATHSLSGFTSRLNDSNLKKRIIMMNSNTSGPGKRMRVLALLPCLAVAISAATLPSVQNLLNEISASAPQEIQASEISVPAAAESLSATAEAAGIQSPEEKIVDNPDVIATYPGGESAMLDKLVQLIKYPPTAIKDSVEGRVIVRFIVGKDGKTSGYKVIKSVRKDLDQASIDVAKSLGNFRPAKLKGEKVASYYTLPITFKLNPNSPGKK